MYRVITVGELRTCIKRAKLVKVKPQFHTGQIGWVTITKAEAKQLIGGVRATKTARDLGMNSDYLAWFDMKRAVLYLGDSTDGIAEHRIKEMA